MPTIQRRLRSAKADALTDVEANLLLNGCRDWYDFAVVLLPWKTGMRIGEVQHLRASWIDWNKNDYATS